MLRRSLISFLLLGPGVFAQVYPPGPQVLSFVSDVDGKEQPYALYLPRSFEPSRSYPLVISLHGAESNHLVNLRRVMGIGTLLRQTSIAARRELPPVPEIGFIVASPFARGTMGYQGIPEKDVYDVLADVKRRFHIDEDRIYLTGLSMGGGGTLWLGLTRPDIWAAIAPVCPAVPQGTRELAPNALNLPVHLFHGDADPIVPVEVSRQWQKLLVDLGTDVEYVEFPNVRHNSWDFAYKDGAVFKWFSKFRRNRYPDRVRFVSEAYHYDSAYWVRLDGLTPGTLASIDAKFTGGNQVDVTTRNLDGFTLELAGHARFSPRTAVSMRVDGAPLRQRTSGTISLTRTEKGWKLGRYVPPPGSKRPGAEGPIGEALAARQVYIYGTADRPGEEELRRRREVAVKASEWSGPRSHLRLSFPVKADKEVTAEDLAQANLILFGTRETNSLVARYAANMPLSLNPGAADYGLVFVAPLETGRYAVVSSGLPWWTGANEARRPGYDFMPEPFRVLLTFQDYLFFKGSLANVIAEGRFDRNWKLSADAAAKMREAGTVVIQ